MLASDGYPGDVVKGAMIPEIATDEDSHVYYAGVKKDEDGNLVASSGRVLLVESHAPSIAEAQQKAYAILDAANTDGMFYRHDIGAKALKA